MGSEAPYIMRNGNQTVLFSFLFTFSVNLFQDKTIRWQRSPSSIPQSHSLIFQ